MNNNRKRDRSYDLKQIIEKKEHHNKIIQQRKQIVALIDDRVNLNQQIVDFDNKLDKLREKDMSLFEQIERMEQNDKNVSDDVSEDVSEDKKENKDKPLSKI